MSPQTPLLHEVGFVKHAEVDTIDGVSYGANTEGRWTSVDVVDGPVNNSGFAVDLCKNFAGAVTGSRALVLMCANIDVTLFYGFWRAAVFLKQQYTQMQGTQNFVYKIDDSQT